MIRLGLLFVLCGCGEDKHSLPAIKAATEDPVKPPLPTPTVDTSTISGRLKSLFGATQSPDLSGSIEKLEAQRATMSEPERKLIDRTIALMRTGEAAASETDRVKARPLQIQVMRDTIALLADMSAIAPDDLDLQAMVAGSFWMTAPNIESMEMADDIPPRPIRQRAKTIAERMTKVHPSAAKAWSMHFR